MDTQKYVMKKSWYKIILRFIVQAFIALLSFSWSLATKSISLNSDPCLAKPALIDLNSSEL